MSTLPASQPPGLTVEPLYRRAMEAAKVPPLIQHATVIALAPLSPPPTPEWVVARLKSREGRDVREAYRSGERDLGRLVFLVGRHVIGLDEAHAYSLVPYAAQRHPGWVSPRFVEEARRGGASANPTFGAETEEEAPFGEAFVPVILIASGVACLFLLKNLLE